MEAFEVEFTITCPIDGAVEVGLEDIDTVVLRESDRADISFVCPHCGTGITVTAIVPAFLLAAIEALAEDSTEGAHGFVVIGSPEGDVEDKPVPVADDARAEAYCEYFRRQLDHVASAADALDEIDSKRSSV